MADELISRQAVIEMAFEEGEFKDLVSLWDLHLLPAVDAVEVVRCKDCKYYMTDDVDICACPCGLHNPRSNDFCSYGERRGDHAAD